MSQGGSGRLLWDDIEANDLPPYYRPTAEDRQIGADYAEAFKKLRGLYRLSCAARSEPNGDGNGFDFTRFKWSEEEDFCIGSFNAPQYLSAPYVFEPTDAAINVFNDYIDDVNRNARPYYEPGGDAPGGAYWRKSTSKVLQLASLLRLFDWTTCKPGSFTETGEPKTYLDAEIMRRAVKLVVWYSENFLRIINNVRGTDDAPTFKTDEINPTLKARIIEKIEAFYNKDGKPVGKSRLQRSIRDFNKAGKGKELTKILKLLTDKGEIFGNLKDGFRPASSEPDDENDDLNG